MAVEPAPSPPPPAATHSNPERTVGLFGATSIGVGAIVGGGILALAGVAFAAAGPAALIAFVLNGAIAFLTAMSFAELSAMFPFSGGSYAFAKRVLSVRAAFTLGWIVFFASVVAGVLYALGFAQFALLAFEQFLPPSPALQGRLPALLLAAGAVAFYTFTLSRRSGNGGDWATIGKVVVFAVLIVAGLAALVRLPVSEALARLEPFAPEGLRGIFAAMGFSFIAFQGFDLIAAAGGEIRNPGRTIPRAMFLSLALALAIYLPLLLVVATVGVPAGEDVTSLSRRFPETVIAVAAQTFLGRLGFWLVVVAALLSMLSALQANLFAASRIAYAMARDRTLPRRLGQTSAQGVPRAGLLASAGVMLLTLLLLPDVAAAGAAASLIFLMVFMLAHGIAFLARRRAGERPLAYRTPFFPAVPIVGGLACASLAVFQGVVVPVAGAITLGWIVVGLAIYLQLFARQARALDAHAEAVDPDLVQLRGRSPLVLTPIANPANAAALVTVASALAPPSVGRVLLLSVVRQPSTLAGGNAPDPLVNAQQVLREALSAAFEVGLYPEALTTVAADPWREMIRVAHSHRCESLVLGLSDLANEATRQQLNDLISRVDSDVVVLRAPPGWQPAAVRRVLIPIGGKGDHEPLRARLLGSLSRLGSPEVTYLRVVPSSTTDASLARLQRSLALLTADRSLGAATAEVVRSDDPLQEISARACESDLLILGLQRLDRQRRAVGPFVREIAARTSASCAIVLISHRG